VRKPSQQKLLRTRMVTNLFRIIFLIAPLTALVGCEPTCKKTCKKLLDCDNIETARTEVEECQASCEIQQEMFDGWEASDERERFKELKQCIRSNECADIANGECYDEELYIW
jgi:hypothetical protein